MSASIEYAAYYVNYGVHTSEQGKQNSMGQLTEWLNESAGRGWRLSKLTPLTDEIRGNNKVGLQLLVVLERDL